MTLSTYLPVSECVEKLMNGMFGKLRRSAPLMGVKEREGERLRLRYGPWREKAAQRIREATLDGELKVYLIPRPTEEQETYPTISEAMPEPLPIEAIRLIVPVRDGLPDNPVRTGRGPWKRRIETGSLLIDAVEFDGWYKQERLRGLWPTQVSCKKPRRGRPRIDDTLEQRIMEIVVDGGWTAQRPIADLLRDLALIGMPASKDTVTRIIERLFLVGRCPIEAGDFRLNRPKRRPPRKTHSRQEKRLGE